MGECPYFYEGHVFRGLDTADARPIAHDRGAVHVVFVKVESTFP